MTTEDYRLRLAADRQTYCPGCNGIGIVPGLDFAGGAA